MTNAQVCGIYTTVRSVFQQFIALFDQHKYRSGERYWEGVRNSHVTLTEGMTKVVISLCSNLGAENVKTRFRTTQY